MVASHRPATGDLAHNPGVCPDWKSNPLVHRLALNPPSHTSQGRILVISNKKPFLNQSASIRDLHIFRGFLLSESLRTQGWQRNPCAAGSRRLSFREALERKVECAVICGGESSVKLQLFQTDILRSDSCRTWAGMVWGHTLCLEKNDF